MTAVSVGEYQIVRLMASIKIAVQKKLLGFWAGQNQPKNCPKTKTPKHGEWLVCASGLQMMCRDLLPNYSIVGFIPIML